MKYFALIIHFFSFIITSNLLASDQFKSSIEYANKWIVITATEKESGKCKNGSELNTNFFTGLKDSLYVCVASAFESKIEAISSLESMPKGVAYMKHTGSYIENLEFDSLFLKKNLFFTVKLSDSAFLQCVQTTKQSDPIHAKEGNPLTYNLFFQSYKNKNKLQSVSINVINYSEIERFFLDSNTLAITFIESAVDENSLHILCWSTSGEKKYYKSFFNSVSEDEAEIVQLKKIGEKYTLVNITKKNGLPDQKKKFYWNGHAFQ